MNQKQKQTRTLLKVRVNGAEVAVPAGVTVAAAVYAAFGDEAPRFRRSVSGEARAPLCGMGICYECRVTIDGRPHARSCQILCADGMDVKTDE
ncbi:MAG TPA: 2Fe-2S iron-sulfur cluster-binding protein [Candidatus Acidoferrum sp.]|nr:2Fe-2S iron-sulfur cluster-binding protein [Candidatus Acidoferrum sp.]